MYATRRASTIVGALSPLILSITGFADTTWPAGSTHTLAVDFVVVDGLTIEEGVTVHVGNGARLIVAGGGSLVVNGSDTNPVLFTSIDDDRWGGIVFEPGSAGVVSHAIVEHVAPTAIHIDTCAPTIEFCQILDVASASTATPARAIVVESDPPGTGLTRPIIRGTRIDGVSGAGGTTPGTAGSGPNGPNGGNGTTLAPNGGNGTSGGTGSVGAPGGTGGDAYGIDVGNGAAATLLANQIRAVVAGDGGAGGQGGKGGKGGNGGNGVSGIFNGNGGNAADGGKGGGGGAGGHGGQAIGLRLAHSVGASTVVDGLLIESTRGGAAGIGGAGGAGGTGGTGGNGASCGVVGCNAGDGGDGGNGGMSGAGGASGTSGDARAIFADGVGSGVFAHITVAAVSAGAPDMIVLNPDGLPPDSTCLVPQGGVGCDDGPCMAIVCGIDPFCCQALWDGICAAEAASLCEDCGPPGCPIVALGGTPGAGGGGGNGGDAFFEAQDGEDGQDGGSGTGASSGALGTAGVGAGALVNSSTIALVNSIVDLEPTGSAASWGELTALVATGNAHVDVRGSCLHGFDELMQTSGGATIALAQTLLDDPGFVAPDDYRLASDSPCIDASKDLTEEFERSAWGWKTVASGATAFAFDEFAAGISNGTGCLMSSPAQLDVDGTIVTLTSESSGGTPLCAISDGSTPAMVSDGTLSGVATTLSIEFDPPIVALYTYYGSVNAGTSMHLRLFDGTDQLADLVSAPSPVDVLASGHGFISTRSVDRVEFEATADAATLVGAFVGLVSTEQSLGTVELRDYDGPAGTSVQFDLAFGHEGDVQRTDVDNAPRVVDGDDDGIAVADIGAYEFDSSPQCLADLNEDGTVTAADLASLLGSWGACGGCPADLTGDGTVDAADLAILLGGWGLCP